MNPWVLIGATTVFLVIAVIIAIVFVVMKAGSVSSAEAGPSTLAGVMIIITIVVVIGAFAAYFNGAFNKYKTTPDALTIKYDYLAFYEPVGILKGVTPATYNDSSKAKFDSIAPQFKTMYKTAVLSLLQNKPRVETALSNVYLEQDTKVLTNYNFSVPCVKLATFMLDNIDVIMENDEVVIRSMIEVESSLGVESSSFEFAINDGTVLVKKINIKVIPGIYMRFVQAYPSLASACIKNNLCPFTQ